MSDHPRTAIVPSGHNEPAAPLCDFRVIAHGGEVVVSCATCMDEIGSSLRSIRLNEIERCVERHQQNRTSS